MTKTTSRQTGRVPVVVLGMHRSGTSLLTCLLECLGVNIGRPENRLPANRHNPRGYWENERILEINDEILRRLGGSWSDPPAALPGWEKSEDFFDLREKAGKFLDDEFRGSELWGWKDPRTCLTLPFWLQIVPDMRIVLSVRNPIEVIRSLQERDGLSPSHSDFLWRHYTASAFSAAAGRHLLIVDHEDLYREDDETFGRTEAFLRQQGADTTQAGRGRFLAYRNEDFRHHKSTFDRLDREPVCDAASKILYTDILNFAKKADSPGGAEKIRAGIEAQARRVLESGTAYLSGLHRIRELLAKTAEMETAAAKRAAVHAALEADLAAVQAKRIGAEQENGRLRSRIEALELEMRRQAEKNQADAKAAQERFEARTQALRERSEMLAQREGQRLELQNAAQTAAAQLKEERALSSALAAKLAERQEYLRTALMEQEMKWTRELDAKKMLIRDGLEREKEAGRKLAVLHQKVGQLEKLLRENTEKAALATRELHRSDARIMHLQAQLMAMRGSKLFRYSRPLRAMWRRLRGGDRVPAEMPQAAGNKTVRAALERRAGGAARLRLRQIYYAESHKPHLLESCEPYLADQADAFLENSVIERLHEQNDHADCDYYGVFSWRFQQKARRKITLHEIRERLDWNPQTIDVYSFYRGEVKGNIWEVSVGLWHPPLLVEIAQKILDRLAPGQTATKLDTPIIYCNFWIARRDVFDRYVKEMLRPAIELMRTDEAIRSLCEQDSDYLRIIQQDPYYQAGSTDNGGRLSPEQCEKLFGRPYYTYHPFVCERLFSTWLALNPQLTIQHLM